MDVSLSPRALHGEVQAPASKSFVHRQLVCAALADAPTRLEFRGTSQDIEASAACVRALGGRCESRPFGLQAGPVPRPVPGAPALDAGESGSTARFFLPVCAAVCTAFSLGGRGRLPGRPFGELCGALRAHGCEVSSDTLPLRVRGSLCPGEFVLPGNVSSQYITGLLLALPLLGGDSRIRLTTPAASAGYLAITQQVLAQFGVRVQPAADGYRVPGGQRYHSPGALAAEGDWSNAAFWLAASALSGGGVRVRGLCDTSVQGDRAVVGLIERILAPGGCRIDADPVPDLLPALAVLAAGQRKTTVFENAARLRLKESDRLASTRALLTALGGEAETGPDTLTVVGHGGLEGGEVDGAGDHRIVMAAAAASVCCRGPVVIRGAQAADKSYPAFFEDFKSLGGCLDVV